MEEESIEKGPRRKNLGRIIMWASGRHLTNIFETSGWHLGVISQASWRNLERHGSLLESKTHLGDILESSGETWDSPGSSPGTLALQMGH